MRIVSGSLKGRRISAPDNLPARPTTDLAKESLFNILNNHIDFDEIEVIDLFAGIGSISYEFASRGVKRVVAVEQNPKCADFIRKTIEQLKIEQLTVLRENVFTFIDRGRMTADLIFADPPYDLPNLNSIPNLIFEKNILRPNGILVLEHSKSNDFSAHPRFTEVRKYGKVHFSFFA